MWKVIAFVLLPLPLTGCITPEDRFTIDQQVALRGYTRAEVDAINARSECRALARTLIQVARCDGR
jgi:hypothetical protein